MPSGVPEPPAQPRLQPAAQHPRLREFEQWSAEAQDLALELIAQNEHHPYRPFYCPDPTCSGAPHDDWQWNHARADQRPPSFKLDWLVWLLLSGRGSGKTRTGSELTNRMTEHVPRIALVAPTGPDFRDTMVEGVSGILACSPPDKRPLWEPSKKRLTWPNGCIAQGFSGEEPDRLRGPQSGFAWVDEPAHMPLISDVWDNLLFGLRLGRSPRICATTTPKPTKWVKETTKDPRTIVSRASTYANLANLAENYKRTVLDKYEGTRLGRQELHGEILEDVEGALWKLSIISYIEELREHEQRIVSIDPAGTANKKSDDTGLIVAGKIGREFDVLADRTGKYSPEMWAREALWLYHQFDCDAIVAEKNYGGDMVKAVLSHQDENVRIILVTSRRGKALRAEPVVSLYEQGRVFHLKGQLPLLEEEQTSWVPGIGASPNRVDALVHAITHLGKITGVSNYATPAKLRAVRA
jgi:phage terminase large subunit-like protein